MTPRQHALSCVRDAVSRAGLSLTVGETSSVEGTFIEVRTAEGPPLMLIDATAPDTSAFDHPVRDRARALATRLQIPLVAVTNFRHVVCFDTEALTRRQPDEEHTIAWYRAADAFSMHDLYSAASTVRTTDAFRRLLQDVHKVDAVRTPCVPTRTAQMFLRDRVVLVLADVLACTTADPGHVQAVLRLGTSVVAYSLLQMRRYDTLDALRIPYGMRSTQLMLDVVGAYLRQARACGFTMFPLQVNDLYVVPGREDVFRSSMLDLINFLHGYDAGRMDDLMLLHSVDGILQWAAQAQQRTVPTLDAIDVVLRASLHGNRSLHGRTPMRVLELGDTLGLFSVRTLLMNGLDNTEAHVYAPTLDEERTILLRASGHLWSVETVGTMSDLRILRPHQALRGEWDVVCFASSDISERHRIRLLLRELPVTPDATVALFLPMSALHDERYAGVRAALTERYAIEWVIVSEAQSLSTPDAGLCCIIARNASIETVPTARFICIRRPLSEFFPSSVAPRDLDGKRLHAIDAFVRYLDVAEHGKNNAEALVRVVPQRRVQELANSTSGSWEDLVIPPDVLAGILRKTLHVVRPLTSLGSARNGLRTGANDVLMPSSAEIASEELELRFWQRSLPNGSMVDNAVLMHADELVSITGMPRTEKRLLCIQERRADLAGTNVLTRIERAEREGVHTRTSLRDRDPWYDIGEPESPHLIVPKRMDGRWLICTNPTSAFIGDAFVGIHLNNPEQADAIAAWLNSSLGMFICALSRRMHHQQDITLRDAEDFLIPTDDILAAMDLRACRDFLRRPITGMSSELGASAADAVSPHTLIRDRRKLDTVLMRDVFHLTDEEERWLYRFILAWQMPTANVRHIVNALASVIETTHRVRPLSSWYTPAVEQLPEEHRRTVILPAGVDRAETSRTMFSWQVTLYRGHKAEDMIDCTSQEEADIIAVFAELGKLHIDIPTDPPIIADLLPSLERFRTALEHAIADVMSLAPAGHAGYVRDALRSMMTRS